MIRSIIKHNIARVKFNYYALLTDYYLNQSHKALIRFDADGGEKYLNKAKECIKIENNLIEQIMTTNFKEGLE